VIRRVSRQMLQGSVLVRRVRPLTKQILALRREAGCKFTRATLEVPCYPLQHRKAVLANIERKVFATEMLSTFNSEKDGVPGLPTEYRYPNTMSPRDFVACETHCCFNLTAF